MDPCERFISVRSLFTSFDVQPGNILAMLGFDRAPHAWVALICSCVILSLVQYLRQCHDILDPVSPSADSYYLAKGCR